MIKDGKNCEAHPTFWVPFILISSHRKLLGSKVVPVSVAGSRDEIPAGMVEASASKPLKYRKD
jgi:hypothetical protein